MPQNCAYDCCCSYRACNSIKSAILAAGGDSVCGCCRSAAYYQRKLLDVAVALLKPGGALVYSTCSICPGTIEHMVYSLGPVDPGPS